MIDATQQWNFTPLNVWNTNACSSQLHLCTKCLVILPSSHAITSNFQPYYAQLVQTELQGHHPILIYSMECNLCIHCLGYLARAQLPGLYGDIHTPPNYFLSTLTASPTPTCTNLAIRWRPAPFPHITINTDGVLPHSLLATNWLNTNADFPVEFSNLVTDCRWLLRQDWEVRVEHVWQEANSCADGLAKRGASQSERQVFYDTCPIFCVEVSLLGFFGFCVLL